MDEAVAAILAAVKDMPWPEAQKALDLASHQVKVRPDAPAPPTAAKAPPWGAARVEEDEVSLPDHTVAELRDIADRENVDLTGLTLKDDIVAEIRKARRRQARAAG